MNLLNVPKLTKLFFACSVALFGCRLMPMQGERVEPLSDMKYRTAFDQSKIHRDFADCMEQWGCSRNVFGDALPQAPRPVVARAYDGVGQATSSRRTFLFPEEIDFLVTRDDDTVRPQVSREQAYQDACIAKLRNTRRWALGRPIQSFAATGCMLGGCTYLLQRILDRVGNDTSREATGFGYLNLLYSLAYKAEQAVYAGMHIIRPPEHRLDKLEELFAKNMCFIPRKLWEKIIEGFMAARTNQMSQDTHVNRLEFVVDLTIHKPVKELVIAGNRSLEEATEEICSRIENFFKANYKVPQDCLTEDIVGIQESVRVFLRSLAYNARGNNPIKPLYLKGSHGIGKSYFVVDNLYKWIEELFPGSLRFEQVPYLESTSQLQGSQANEHGIMLDIVRNKCRDDVRGSLVFMDEATWLNSSCMIDAAKVVFNCAQSRISTKYFNEVIDIPVPPMLIIVASNEPIKDEHLANRFTQVEFPRPTVKALIDYAFALADANTSLRLHGINVTRQDVKDFVEPSLLYCLTEVGTGRQKAGVDNFRDADKIIAHLLAKKSRKPLIEEVS